MIANSAAAIFRNYSNMLIWCSNLLLYQCWKQLCCLKETNYASFTICNISLRCPQSVSVKFQLKTPHRSSIISFRKWKQKHAVFVVSLNANEMLLPIPFFPEYGCAFTALTSNILLKSICLVLIIMTITLKSCAH